MEYTARARRVIVKLRKAWSCLCIDGGNVLLEKEKRQLIDLRWALDNIEYNLRIRMGKDILIKEIKIKEGEK